MTDETLEQITWKNLAPDIIRQRLMIEATTKEIVLPDQIIEYLKGLAKITDMEIIGGPFARSAHELGYGGWVHWRTSGAHVYSYPSKPPLVTVDTYTCKPFSVDEAVEFTKDYFKVLDIVWKEIKV